MEFKLGATLWQQPEMGGNLTTRQPSTENFKERLGGTEANFPEAEPAMQAAWKESEPATWVPTRFQVGRMGVLTSSDLVALYDWGQLAGHHLSYEPGALSSEGLSCPQAMSDTEQVSLQPNRAWVAAEHVMAIAGQETGLQINTLLLDSELSAPTEPAQQSAVSFLSGRLTCRWPDRSFTILPREAGLEIVLRDYRLTSEESEQLTQDLKNYFDRSEERLEQIWLNGHSLWQRHPAKMKLAKE